MASDSLKERIEEMIELYAKIDEITEMRLKDVELFALELMELESKYLDAIVHLKEELEKQDSELAQLRRVYGRQLICLLEQIKGLRTHEMQIADKLGGSQKKPTIRPHQLSLDKRIEYYKEEIKKNSNNAAAHYCLGFALRLNNDADGAIREYKKAIELNPRHVMAHCNLGNIYLERKQAEQARDHFQKAADLGSTYAPDKLDKIENFLFSQRMSRQ